MRRVYCFALRKVADMSLMEKWRTDTLGGGSTRRKRRERPLLWIRPRPSRRLAALVLVAHGAALAVVFAIPLDWYWRVLLAAAVVGGLARALGAHVLYLAPRAVREATWDSDGTWTLTLVSGEREKASLLPSTYVTARLLVLSFRCGRWRHRALVLTTDALEPNLLRRLRVRLRLAERKAETDVFT